MAPPRWPAATAHDRSRPTSWTAPATSAAMWPRLRPSWPREADDVGRDGTMQLHGIHHLTAITADARGNHDFYTRTLGLRLVKKTVNQDDPSASPLFYADGAGSPGPDVPFFDWPPERGGRGTQSIVRTALRVAGED